MDYWKRYWNDSRIVGGKNLQKNVGRTKHGIPITKKVWRGTIQDIEKILSLDKKTSEVLELCCGNGQVIGNLVSKCKNATGVDYSDELLEQLKSNYGECVKLIHSDVLDICFNEESFNVVIIYFSIQNFNEKETIHLIHKIIGWLKTGGKLYLGDIPNKIKKWEYINKPKYKRDYIQRVLDDRPLIGNWFHPDFFIAIESFFKENIEVEILKQPSYHINSKNRFDVLIHKK